MIASMISWPQWLVHSVTGLPSSGHTTVPRFASTSTGRKVPSFFGVCGSIRNDSATATAERVFGIGRVDEADHLRVRVRQIDDQVAVALGDGGAHVDVGDAVAVIVEQRLAAIDAVLPGRDHGAGLALGAVEDRLDGGMGGRPAELLRQPQDAPLAEPRRADHRREVAAEVVGMADIDDDHLHDVALERRRARRCAAA